MTRNAEDEPAGRAELREVAALYLDSQPVSNGSGFQRGAAIEEILELARSLNVEVNIPEAVIIELQCQFERELVTAQNEAVTACKRVAKIATSDYAAPSLDVAVAIGRHNAQIREFVQRYRMNIIPFTERTHADLFRMASMRQRPFREASKAATDAGFKDALIYTSVVDHVRSHRRPAALLSRDTDYAGAERLLEGRSLVKASAEEILSELRRRADARLLEQADQRRRLADSDLKRDARQIELIKEFARANFVVPDLMPVPFGLTRYITDRQVLNVEVRHLVPLMNDVEPGQSVHLTVNALGRVHLLPRSDLPDPFTPALTLGLEVPKEPRPFDVVGVLNVTAERTRDGYTNFRPESMNVPTGFISATKHQKIDADAWIRKLRERGIID